MALEAITLSGRHVELVPLAHEHHDGLAKPCKTGTSGSYGTRAFLHLKLCQPTLIGV
jgi:hypothetical protein